MKTNTKNQNQNERLKSRPEQVSTGTLTPEQIRDKVRLFNERRANRELRNEVVLNLLKTQLPQQYELAEIVGRWIWLDVPRNKYRAAVNTLWRLGFHWNQRRHVWQHPCGVFAPYTPHPGDPREKYGSHFAAA